ncbi:MAG: hypothetical protein PHU25_14230 [Deltaproteobacteria bacterium]|nr:hypothetical protein [Deltaproteobacteria bacterium]
MKRRIVSIVLLALAAPAPALAQDAGLQDAGPAEAAPAPPPAPESKAKPEKAEGEARVPPTLFFHTPPSTALPGEVFEIRGDLQQGMNKERFFVRYRIVPKGEWKAVPLRRAAEGGVVAIVPAKDMQPPGIEYYVANLPPDPQGQPELRPEESKGPLANETRNFGSPEQPHRVLVHGFTSETLYEKRLADHQGHLSRLAGGYGYSNFGRHLVTHDDPINAREPDVTTEENGKTVEWDKSSEHNIYHEITLTYTYRFLTYLYDLSVQMGALAESPSDFDMFTNTSGKSKPGMYYISPSAQLEFFKYFGATVLFRLGISDDGFEGGAGGSLRVGRVAGTRVDVGGEWMSRAGGRFFLRFGWDTVPHLPMAITIERTQWYHRDMWGNRLFYEIGWDIYGGFGINARIGYAARDESTNGSVVAGGGASMEF